MSPSHFVKTNTSSLRQRGALKILLLHIRTRRIKGQSHVVMDNTMNCVAAYQYIQHIEELTHHLNAIPNLSPLKRVKRRGMRSTLACRFHIHELRMQSNPPGHTKAEFTT